MPRPLAVDPYSKRVSANERKQIEGNLARDGVVLYQGEASFVDPHTIRVIYAGSVGETDEVLLGASHILIATGSFPV
jgi:pyruvate/2-oxoglutarate dehydrogenase complex dihydrolipoamide dehydrogenase (E3) component